MKKQDGYYVKSREIDLKRMLWWIARQWRKLLVFSVVCACVMVTWKYIQDERAHMAAYQAALAEQEANASVKALEESLTEEEMLGVNTAFYYWKRAEEASDYLSNSFLLKMNPYEINMSNIYYQISDQQIPGELKQFISSERFLNNLKEELGWDIKNIYLLELFELKEEGNRTVISIQADTQENCELLTQQTMKIVEGQFGNAIEEAYYTMGVTNNLDLVKLFNDIYDNEHTSITIYNNYEVGINDKQRALLIKMQTEALGGGAEELSIEEPKVIELEKTHLSKKIFLLGAAAGILIGAVVLAILFTFSANIHGDKEIKYLFNLPMMGNVSVAKLKKKKWFAFIDRWMDRLVYGKIKYSEYEKQIQMIVMNIYLVCHKNSQNTVFLSGSEMDKVPETFLKDVQTQLQKKDIKATIGKCISYDADSLLAAAEAGNLVLVEVDEASKCEEIAMELNLCMQNQIESLGVIVVQA